jgi:hypothetical protein
MKNMGSWEDDIPKQHLMEPFFPDALLEVRIVQLLKTFDNDLMKQTMG